MKRTIFFLMAILLFLRVDAQSHKNLTDNSNKLAVLWTSGNPDVAEKMCFMYTYNAKNKDGSTK